MTDFGFRMAVIAMILIVIGVAAAIAGRSRRARPLRTIREDLPPGVHLFTSSTCATCTQARSVISSTYGEGFTEIRHEDDPVSFGRHGIARVPTAIVVAMDGTALVFEGVPAKRHLPPSPPASSSPG